MKSLKIETILDASGWVDAKGFQAGSIACDIRKKGDMDRLDLCVLYSEQPCSVAGVFTLNQIFAAPVKVCREVLAAGMPCHAIVANSGNANACTGDPGERDARAMQAVTANGLSLDVSGVMVCSTGRIGEDLPMDRVEAGIGRAIAELGANSCHGVGSARAILTSDTREKICARKVSSLEGAFTVSAIAKGAGMIQPGMATMLCFISTDAAVGAALLQECLRNAVDLSFNAITVDGDMSTNDSVILLANGASGVSIDKNTSELLETFQQALTEICRELAAKIVGDGEKITKVVRIQISGAPDDASAEKIARSIGNSLLVKTSWYGGDPNWGRLLDAAGYAGVPMVEKDIELYYHSGKPGDAPVVVFSQGRAHHGLKPEWKEVVASRSFVIQLNLNGGSGAYELLASDLTEGYVHFNKSE